MLGNNTRGPATAAPPQGMPPLPPQGAPRGAAPGPMPGAMPTPPRDGIAAVIDLSQPLPGHDREHWKIELRYPTFGDWLECGDIHETIIHDPRGMQVGDGGAVHLKVNHDSVAKWFARLSGLPLASLAKLSMPDSRKVLREVAALVGNLDAGN